jgi:hypothetical protein
MIPTPVYTFLVNNIDYSTIYSQPLPNSIENVIGNLNSQSVYVPYINRPLKNGDIFTLYGKRAQIVYDMFIGKEPKILEFLARTDYIPTLITKDLDFDKTSLPVKSALSNTYTATVLNYSGSDASFNLKAYSSDHNLTDVSISINGVLDSSSPSDTFLLSQNNGTVLNLVLTASTKFYFAYGELTF